MFSPENFKSSGCFSAISKPNRIITEQNPVLIICPSCCSPQDERGADRHGVRLRPEGAVGPPLSGRHPPRHQERLYPAHPRRTGRWRSMRARFILFKL